MDFFLRKIADSSEVEGRRALSLEGLNLAFNCVGNNMLGQTLDTKIWVGVAPIL
jgi:hypothetical protein